MPGYKNNSQISQTWEASRTLSTGATVISYFGKSQLEKINTDRGNITVLMGAEFPLSVVREVIEKTPKGDLVLLKTICVAENKGNK